MTILAPTLARAVYDMLKRKTACARDRFLRTSGSRAGEPDVSLDTQREEPASRVLEVLFDCVCEREGAPRPGIPEPCALIGHPLWLLHKRRPVAQGGVGCPSPEPGTHWPARFASPFLCIGRYEGTELFLGRRAPPTVLCNRHASGDCTSIRVWCSHMRLAPTHGNHVRTRHRGLTAPGLRKAEKKAKNPLSGGVCLLTKGSLISVRHGIDVAPDGPFLLSLRTLWDATGGYGVGRVPLDLDDLLDRWEGKVACHCTADNRCQQEMAQLRRAWFLCQQQQDRGQTRYADPSGVVTHWRGGWFQAPCTGRCERHRAQLQRCSLR